MFYQPKYNLAIHRNYTRNKTRIMVKYSQKVKEPQTIVAFYEMFKKVFPFKIKKWQNDNGHENLRLFQQRLKQDGIKQVFSYPRCLKINAYIERFNKTLRELFIDINGILIKEKEEFDNLLINWLLYYNSRIAHLALNLKAHLQYMLYNYKMANVCLTNTQCVEVRTHIGLCKRK